MSSSGLPSLPSLPADLHWLLVRMRGPTREALDEYLHPPNPLPQGVRRGAHTGPLTISNIVASAPSASERQRRYDFIPCPPLSGADPLADAGGADLLPQPLCDGPACDDHVEASLLSAPVEIREPYRAIPGATYTSYGPPDAKVLREVVQRRGEQRQTQVALVARMLSFAWSLDLDAYEQLAHGVPVSRSVLMPYLSPLPTRELLEALANDVATHHLLLLRGRHELGYLYLKVQAWHKRAQTTGYVLPEDTCLGDDDLGLLSARARGPRYWATGPATDGSAYRREDAPTTGMEPTSDLAGLYWQLYGWYNKAYRIVTHVRCCERCHRILPPYKGTGRPPSYCSDACGKLKRAQVRREKHDGGKRSITVAPRAQSPRTSRSAQ